MLFRSPIMRELLVDNAQRAGLAAQIVSASRAFEALPASMRSKLDGKAAANLIKSGAALEARFSALTDGGDYSVLLSAEAVTEIQQGKSSIIVLRQLVANGTCQRL